MAEPPSCQECGCVCDSCYHDSNSLHLHQEIEDLKQRLVERDYHIIQMETSMMVDAENFPNGKFIALKEEMTRLQDKYDRLLESHRKLQKVNQGLEDKLLKMVDKYESEKSSLNSDVTKLTSQLVDAQVYIEALETENDRYRQDCSLAVQLLQCRPSSFLAHRLDALPVDLRDCVRTKLVSRRNSGDNNSQPATLPELRTIRVPIPTFPPTAVVYSLHEDGVNDINPTPKISPKEDLVSAAIMAKVLEERAKERSSCSARSAVKWRWRCQQCGSSNSPGVLDSIPHNRKNSLDESDSSNESCDSIDGHEHKGIQTTWSFSCDDLSEKSSQQDLSCDTSPHVPVHTSSCSSHIVVAPTHRSPDFSHSCRIEDSHLPKVLNPLLECYNNNPPDSIPKPFLVPAVSRPHSNSKVWVRTCSLAGNETTI